MQKAEADFNVVTIKRKNASELTVVNVQTVKRKPLTPEQRERKKLYSRNYARNMTAKQREQRRIYRREYVRKKREALKFRLIFEHTRKDESVHGRSNSNIKIKQEREDESISNIENNINVCLSSNIEFKKEYEDHCYHRIKKESIHDSENIYTRLDNNIKIKNEPEDESISNIENNIDVCLNSKIEFKNDHANRCYHSIKKQHIHEGENIDVRLDCDIKIKNEPDDESIQNIENNNVCFDNYKNINESKGELIQHIKNVNDNLESREESLDSLNKKRLVRRTKTSTLEQTNKEIRQPKYGTYGEMTAEQKKRRSLRRRQNYHLNRMRPEYREKIRIQKREYYHRMKLKEQRGTNLNYQNNGDNHTSEQHTTWEKCDDEQQQRLESERLHTHIMMCMTMPYALISALDAGEDMPSSSHVENIYSNNNQNKKNTRKRNWSRIKNKPINNGNASQIKNNVCESIKIKNGIHNTSVNGHIHENHNTDDCELPDLNKFISNIKIDQFQNCETDETAFHMQVKNELCDFKPLLDI